MVQNKERRIIVNNEYFYYNYLLKKGIDTLEEKDFKKKLELFLNEYISEKVHDIREKNKELIKQKSALAQELQCYEAFWHYEELETQYVILLTTEIYKQALHDFHFFVNDYLK